MLSDWLCVGRRSALLALVGIIGVSGCSKEPTRPKSCPPFNIVSSASSSFTWSPDGRFVAFLDGRDSLEAFAPGIYIVDTSGSPRVKLIDVQGGFARDLAWSPDGTRIAFIYYNELWTVNLADRSTRQWTSSGLYPYGPDWSPDGRYIAFTYSTHRAFTPDSTSGLHILDTVDGTQRTVFHDDTLVAGGGYPRWSPDGQSFVFEVGTLETASNLYTLGVDGRNYRQITHERDYATRPHWSADGRRIFFLITPAPCIPEESPTTATYVVSADGTGLARWPVNFGDPRVQFGFRFELSPDGERVAFVGLNPAGTSGVLWVMRLDGTGRKQLTLF